MANCVTCFGSAGEVVIIQSLPCISPGGMNGVCCLLWVVFRGLLVPLLMYMKDFAVCEQLVINLDHRMVKGTDVEVQGNDMSKRNQTHQTEHKRKCNERLTSRETISVEHLQIVSWKQNITTSPRSTSGPCKIQFGPLYNSVKSVQDHVLRRLLAEHFSHFQPLMPRARI